MKSYSNDNIIRLPAVIMFIIINMLFLAKYTLRLDNMAITITALAVYPIIVSLCLRYKAMRCGNNTLLAAASVLLAMAVILQTAIDPYTLKVDRWSAIHFWWDHLMHGQYPYSANTHLGGYGSPFPVWQIIHAPFYMLGNVGLSFIVGVTIFVIAVKRYFGTSAACTSVICIALSPAWIYEVAVRSDLLTNFFILTAAIIFLYETHSTLSNRFWLIAIISGLFMGTRLATLVPLSIFLFGYWLRDLNILHKIVFVATVLAVFALLFVPFLLWDSDMLLFFEYNPFALQSKQGYATDFLIFIPLGIFLALSWKGMRQLCVACAVMIILFIGISFLHFSIKSGNFNWFSSRFDITYFSMALPFLITAMAMPEKQIKACSTHAAVP